MKRSASFPSSSFNDPNGIQDFASTSGPENKWHISILIPARNEEALLVPCLASVQRARMRLPAPITSDVVLVDDESSDGTYAIAKEYLQGFGTVVQSSGRLVGKARALAAQIAISRYAGPADRHWLANTDADCIVPETWLLSHLAAARANIEAVAGIVSVGGFEEHDSAVERRFRESYVLHADGTHPHVHGANLGVRSDVYQRAGGWSALATAEDHDLWNRLRETGCSQRSLSSLSVVTSGRRIGRAPMGFADALAAHNGVNTEEVITEAIA